MEKLQFCKSARQQLNSYRFSMFWLQLATSHNLWRTMLYAASAYTVPKTANACITQKPSRPEVGARVQKEVKKFFYFSAYSYTRPKHKHALKKCLTFQKKQYTKKTRFYTLKKPKNSTLHAQTLAPKKEPLSIPHFLI